MTVEPFDVDRASSGEATSHVIDGATRPSDINARGGEESGPEAAKLPGWRRGPWRYLGVVAFVVVAVLMWVTILQVIWLGLGRLV